MKSICILGYYGKRNLGDDLFQNALTFLIRTKYPSASITFANPKDIDRIPGHPDIIFVGGGDLINDYFMSSLRNLLKDKTCPVYGIGIGFPYPNLINNEYLDIFDILVTRTKSSVPKLHQAMPGRSFYGPDLVRFIPSTAHKKQPKRIGVFFANSICSPDSPLVQKLVEIVKGIADKGNPCLGKKYIVTLYAMNTSGSPQEDDNILNRAIYKYIDYDNVEIIEEPLNPENINHVFSTFYATICTRFHAHILSLMTETPFISLYSTEKVKDLLQTENLSHYSHKMITDPRTLKPIFFDPNDVLYKFKKLEDNWINYRATLSAQRQKTDLCKLEMGIQNLIFHKPKFGEKRYKKIMHKILKYLRSHEFPQLTIENLEEPGFFNKESSDFVSKVVTFCIDRKIESEYTWGLREQIGNSDFCLSEAVKWVLNNIPQTFDHWDTKTDINLRKYNLDYFNPHLMKGLHRSGWEYVVSNIQEYHNPKGTVLDVYSDKTFGWNRELYKKMGILPFRRSWIGFFHHTPNTDYSNNNLTSVIESDEFKKSLKKCKGVFVLSNYVKEWFQHKFPELKVYLMHHPTQVPDNLFDYSKFMHNNNKKVIQIGAWYRNSYSIYALPHPKDFKKVALKGCSMENYFAPHDYFEKLQDCLGVDVDGEVGPCRVGQQLGNKFVVGLLDHIKESYEKVEIMEKLTNDEYDELLAQNIVFINLIDASACNTIIECIVRGTPILINRLPAVVEYLGFDYPLYYSSLDEARELLNNPLKIKKAHKYLVKKDKSFLTIDHFLKKFEMIQL